MLKLLPAIWLFLLMSGCQTTPGIGGQNALSKASINTEHRYQSNKGNNASMNYVRLGAGYLNSKHYEKSLVKLKKAVELDQSNAEAYKYLGLLYWRLDETRLAENNFSYAYRLNPLNSSINHHYASFLCHVKKYKQSHELFNKVFANPLYDQLSVAYQQAGDCDFQSKHYDLAQKKYKKAIKLRTNNYFAMLGMAKVFYRLKKYKLSAYYYQRFVEKMKQTPDSLWLGINLQRELADKHKLASYQLELKNLHPDSEQTLMLIEGKEQY